MQSASAVSPALLRPTPRRVSRRRPTSFACVTPTDTPPLYSRRQCAAQDRAASVATSIEGVCWRTYNEPRRRAGTRRPKGAPTARPARHGSIAVADRGCRLPWGLAFDPQGVEAGSEIPLLSRLAFATFLTPIRRWPRLDAGVSKDLFVGPSTACLSSG
jgi:hypothetical protein